MNWRKSTVAAADYFRTLLLLFGDGRGALLAMAAYNAGEEKIKKALNNVENPILDRDFWYLYRTSSILAVETREYVPQVLARIIIDRHPGLYGF
jgi:soluble lytic murein transglycosylase-like protein